jgi:hypothetical protein
MDRGMRGQLTAPGVEPTQPPALSATGLGGEGASLQSGSRGVEEQGVEACGGGAGDRPQVLGPGKGDETRGHGEKPLMWLLQPPGGCLVVALGAMPMLAGMLPVRQLPAICALGARTAKRFGAARCASSPGCQVAGGHAVAEAGARGGSMASQDLSQLDHASPPETRRGRPGAWGGHRVPWRRLCL